MGCPLSWPFAAAGAGRGAAGVVGPRVLVVALRGGAETFSMKIPHGVANFADIRRGGYFYVDKTPFLPMLESAERG